MLKKTKLKYIFLAHKAHAICGKIFLLVAVTFFATYQPVLRASIAPMGPVSWMAPATDQVVADFIRKLYDYAVPLGLTVAATWSLSQVQKSNPEFFNSVWGACKTPWVLLRKKAERLFHCGESLSWNDIISWRNRVTKLLTPLTKQVSIMDMTKERRLRLIDQEDANGTGTKQELRNEQWDTQVQHIETQLLFMSKQIEKSLLFYQDSLVKQRKTICSCSGCFIKSAVVQEPKALLVKVGKICTRLSVKRQEEIALYLTEISKYLRETVAYFKTVSYPQALDKEHVRGLLGDLCTALEHTATLVDEETAASSRAVVGQLALRSVATQPMGMSGYPSFESYAGTGSSMSDSY